MSALPPIVIPQPCPVSWSSMKGDERVRHCGQCNLFVHRLSALTNAEVAELIERAKTERICVNVCRRADGTVRTKDAPSYWQAAKLAAELRVGRGSTTSVTGVLGLVLFLLISAALCIGTLFGDNIRLLFASDTGGALAGTTVVSPSSTLTAPASTDLKKNFSGSSR